MKVYISYFYNIRFFPNNLLPVSTAVWDPKWYHNFGGNDNVFYDKRGVINGVRMSILSPAKIHDASEDCSKECQNDPNTCNFLSKYNDYLHSLDFSKIYNNLLEGSKLWAENACLEDVDICLMVYEKPDNPCSERPTLINWFKENGVEVEEWVR